MRLRVALAFLTRLPVAGARVFGAAEVGSATPWFPVAGALIGLCTLAGLRAAGLLVPGVPLLGAVLATAATVWLTGALHQDALADVVDALGAGGDRERALRIMRDSRIGAYAVAALVLALLLRVAVYTEIVAGRFGGAWVVAAACAGRYVAVPLAWRLPYARREGGGLGRAITDHVGATQLLGASAALVICASLALGAWPHVLAVVLTTLAIASWAGRHFSRWLGGVTGDALGATTELVELAVLVVGLVLEVAANRIPSEVLAGGSA